MPSKKTKLKHATVIGMFATRSEAEAALRDLRAAGFKDDKIGLIARNASGEMVDESGDTYADEGAVAGAVAGAGVGTLVGLGVLAGVVPVIGPAIVAGTLGTILTNAVGGAAVAGLAGALIGWGIPEDDAAYYESEVKAGRFLVTVDAGTRKDEAWAIIHRHGGYDRTHSAAATRTTAATGTAARGRTTAEAAARSDSGRSVELKEEELRVNKRPVKKGEVEVRKEVVTEQRQITVPVEREEVVIERKPAGRRAAAGDLKAEEIRIPVSEEEVEVRKETKVKEDVKVGKRKVTDTKTVGGTVKHEELRVEETGNVNVRGAGGVTRRRS
jgi:uncharacterized protein (TIGR02271 family)